MPARKQTHHAFILRLWYEDDENRGTWRGWIQHVGSGEKRYLRSQEDILDFLQQHTTSDIAAIVEDDSSTPGEHP